MAEENKGNSSLGLGEISTIRDILMGQQMADYENRFAQQDEKRNHALDEMSRKIEQLEANINQKIQTLSDENQARFEKLEALLLKNTEQLNEKIDSVSRSDKHSLGEMLQKMGSQLLDK